MATLSKITPCLWFDTQAEEAATYYTGIFENSRINEVTRYGSAGPRPEGMVMTVDFELDGQPFVGLNGGPEFTFDEAISFQIHCDSRRRSTGSGPPSPRAARRAPAAGSRTASGCRGRSCPPTSPSC